MERRTRGRPKAPPPFGPRPSWSRPPTSGRQSQDLYDRLRAVEEELIGRTVRKRPTIPHAHVLRLALANELSSREFEELRTADEQLKQQGQKNRREGGKANAAARLKETTARIEELRKKNTDLIAKIKPQGRLSVSSVAAKILDKWAERGDGGKPPPRSTLCRWLKKLTTSSWDKK